MRIAVVLDDGLDKPDGVQQCVLMLNRWLSAQGHEVHYIVGQTTRTDLPNLHVAARNIPVRFNGNRLTIPLPTSQQKLDRLMAEIKPDVIHVHVPYSPFMGAKAIKATPQASAVVGTFHILPYGLVARYATRMLGILLRSSLKRFSAIYAGTDAAADFSTWSTGIQTGVLPHAVAIKQFQVAQSTAVRTSSKVRIVFLGRLVQRKGAVQLVQALAGLSAQTRTKIDVSIGGRGEQSDHLRQLIKRYGLEGCVRLDGFISETDKPAYLANSDIAIFPSISGESFGISLIEAMAASCGVTVGGDNPGYHSVLSPWPECLFDPTDVPAFTAYLEHMIDDRQLRTRIHAEQTEAVKAYDVERIGPQWLTIYETAQREYAARVKQ